MGYTVGSIIIDFSARVNMSWLTPYLRLNDYINTLKYTQSR